MENDIGGWMDVCIAAASTRRRTILIFNRFFSCDKFVLICYQNCLRSLLEFSHPFEVYQWKTINIKKGCD